MEYYKNKGYLYLKSFDLEEKEIRTHLIQKIKKVEEKEKVSLVPYKIYINVVSNKLNKKLGYSYIWTDKIEIYNIFSGLDLDGKDRIILYDDPDWKAPDEEEKKLEDISNWGELAEEEDNKICPQIKKYLPPLTDISYYEKGNYETEIKPMYLDKIGKNVIYSKNVEDWINEKIIRNHIYFFEEDKSKHKNSKNGNFFYYPLIHITKNKKGNTLTITFSPRNPKTASFLINVIKKIKIKSGDKNKLLFFSQSKN